MGGRRGNREAAVKMPWNRALIPANGGYFQKTWMFLRRCAMKALKTVALILGFLLLSACVSGSSGSTTGSSGTITGVTTVAQLSVVTAN